MKNKRVLITSGPTWVAIDDMRVITNKSSGTLGRLLTEKLLKKNARVTLIEGPVGVAEDIKGIKKISFCYFDELKKALNSELKKKYDVVVHAAAVSDYRLKRPFNSKISSSHKNLSLELIPTEKIINSIKRTNKRTFLVGFKLESSITNASVKRITAKLFKEAHCDLVVANSLNNGYRGFVVNKKQRILAQARSRKDIVKQLVKTLEKEMSS